VYDSGHRLPHSSIRTKAVHFITRWKPQWSLNNVLRVGVGVLVVLAFLAHEADIAQSRFVQQLELLAYDARLRLFMPKTLDPRIVILDIDEKSLNAEGRWPWSRNKLALMVRQLFDRYQVRVVGFDVAFPEPDPSSGLATLESLAKNELSANAEYKAAFERVRPSLDYDRVFSEEIAKYPVVLGFFLGGKQEKSGVLPEPTFEVSALGNDQITHHLASGFSGNLPVLQKSATAAGHLYPSLDVDGLTRRVPIFVRFDNGFYEALSLAMIRTYLGNAPAKISVVAQGGFSNLAVIPSVQVGDLRIPLDESISALIPYRGASGVFRYVSATDVIRGTLAADELKDRIVIVGTSAQGLLDLRATPVREDYPGVEVHASLMSGFLDQTIMHHPLEARMYGVLTILLLGIPFAILLPRLSAAVATAAVVALAVLLVAFNMYMWKAEHYVLDIAAPLLMFGLLYFINMAYGFFTEARSRRLITGLFGTYVPRELVEQMSKNPEEYSMRGESRVMTVLFSDVRDFTSISEGLTAEQLKDMMNAYLTAMTEVVQEHRGTIDKYIGDAIMAFWGAPVADPDHVRHGLEAGLEMQKRIRRLDPDFAKRGWQPLHIGVGLNCGEMNVGDMGSKFRRAYTVMGDAVNLASRLEGLTKEYGVGILVSENVVNDVPSYLYREIDRVQVKGRAEGIGIYEPIARLDQVDEATVELVDRFHRMLEHYRAQAWDEADKLLVELAQATPDSKLVKLFRQRIFEFRYNPPGPSWNGVWVFKTK
jgi:adenylate cyclase